MSNHEIDEYELGERTRKWFKENSGSLFTGVALGFACIAGYFWWQTNQNKHLSEAGLQYQSYIATAEKDGAEKSKVVLDLLQTKYAGSPFVPLAVLRQAELLNSAGKNADAMKLLQAQLPKLTEANIKELYQLRIARLHLMNGKPDLAIKQLEGISNSLYPASIEEIRGDAHMASGKKELAKLAYVKAMTALDQAAPTRPIIEIKLIEAGGEVPAQPGA
jgi:predicted negative regulator of RcsB-dependent stress response